MSTENSKKKRPSQREIILTHLQKYNTITSLEGFTLYNITCVTQRIFDLIREGFDISKEFVVEVKPDGRRVNYTRYHYHGHQAEVLT